MPDQIYIGNFNKGQVTSRLPFNIDNDAFPNLYNFYIWRGRAKRKRGTLFLGQLERQVQSVADATPPLAWQIGTLATTDGSGDATFNILIPITYAPVAITGITQAASAMVTVSGTYAIGDMVYIDDVQGMTEINDQIYTVTAEGGGTITIDVDSSGFGAYTMGGNLYLISATQTETLSPSSITLTDGTNTYTEPSTPNGTLIGTPAGSGTVDYATGEINISGGADNSPITGTYDYFPGLPVLGLEDFVSSVSSSLYPLLLAFDEQYSYQINQTEDVVFFYSTSFYKSTNNPVVWSGQDYQQFWTTNYSGALWETNNKPGFHFVNGTYVSGTTTSTVEFTFSSIGNPYTTLVVGDYVWFNEWSGGSTINGITGVVSAIIDAGTGTYAVTFTNSQTVSGTGIAQLLTNLIPGQDGIRWYDGDPTGGTGLPTDTGYGWVNFSPPLTETSVSINNTPPGLYYLVGALMIQPFKDRQLFFSPIIQTSTGAPIVLQDTVLWSWNGTPYYTVSDTNTPPTSSLVPAGETADPTAYYVDETGKGGWIAAGISQPIVTLNNNEDVLLVGFSNKQTRFVYTGNDISPFLFFSINSELGSSATFSGITLDQGGLTIGTYGIAMTDQQSSQRIDLDIPDSVFQIQSLNNGVKRVSSARDFYKEWIYFSYPVNSSEWKFPTQTFLFNYRDNTWAIFYENFTSHGTFRKQSPITWATLPFRTWSQWREPWNSGSTSTQFPSIIAGNPQGYVLIKAQGTGEGRSGTILGISSNSGNTQINSVNHCVAVGDYLYFSNALGTVNATITGITAANPTVITATNTFSVGQVILISDVEGMTQINGKYVKITHISGSQITVDLDSTLYTAYASGGTATISPLYGQIGKVISIQDTDDFTVDIPYVNLGYIGLGEFSRLSQPLLQTKQFPFYWDQGRQTRLAVQKYLMDYTADAQVTVNIYLSQDPDDVWNDPTTNVAPNSLIYSQVMFTCPESSNIGLTPANTNLQMPTAEGQYQIWHRMNTSLIGDSVQIGITLNDAQMRNLDYATNEITLHGMVLSVEKGPHLS